MSSEYHSITGMNIRGKLFGYAKTSGGIPPPPKPVRQAAAAGVQTIEQVEQKIDMIDKKIAHLNQKVKNERQLATQALQENDKESAKNHLVTSRAHQKQIKLLNSHKLNLRNTVIALENASVANDFVSTIAAAKNDIKKHTMDIDKADEILADAADVQAQVNELTDLTSRTIYEDPDTMVDDDELDALLMEESVPATKIKKKAAPRVPSLPTAPSHAISEEDEEDAQLRSLELRM